MSSQDISEQLCQLEFLNREPRECKDRRGESQIWRSHIHSHSFPWDPSMFMYSVSGIPILLLPNELFVGALGKFSQTRQSIHLSSLSQREASHKWIEWEQQQQTITHRKAHACTAYGMQWGERASLSVSCESLIRLVFSWKTMRSDREEWATIRTSLHLSLC